MSPQAATRRSAPVVMEAKGIVKAYGRPPTRVVVLDGVEISVHAGEVVAIEGRSGSGKSTLLNILGCLDRPDGGAYFLGGRNVARLGREARAWVRLHYLGFVFQSFHLIPRATALENVKIPLEYAGFTAPAREERARRLLSRMGLEDRVHHRPSELSGGQKQRVAIARALACGPRVLLADEPTGALDSRAGSEILSLLFELRKTEGLTIVLVTHDAKIAASADRRLYMADGRMSEQGEAARDA